MRSFPTALGFNAITHHASRITHRVLLPSGRVARQHEQSDSFARRRDHSKNFLFPASRSRRNTTLFIAGHGTERNANSRKAIERQVELIRAQEIYAAVHAVFMEEEPRIVGCHLLAQTKYCVVVPFLISDGLHAVEDIPVLLGEPERAVKARFAAGQPTWQNPTEKHGKLFWYSAAAGTEPLLADVILERVAEAAKMEHGK